jgi:hypothetical protein
VEMNVISRHRDSKRNVRAGLDVLVAPRPGRDEKPLSKPMFSFDDEDGSDCENRRAPLPRGHTRAVQPAIGSHTFLCVRGVFWCSLMCCCVMLRWITEGTWQGQTGAYATEVDGKGLACTDLSTFSPRSWPVVTPLAGAGKPFHGRFASPPSILNRKATPTRKGLPPSKQHKSSRFSFEAAAMGYEGSALTPNRYAADLAINSSLYTPARDTSGYPFQSPMELRSTGGSSMVPGLFTPGMADLSGFQMSPDVNSLKHRGVDPFMSPGLGFLSPSSDFGMGSHAPFLSPMPDGGALTLDALGMDSKISGPPSAQASMRGHNSVHLPVSTLDESFNDIDDVVAKRASPPRRSPRRQQNDVQPTRRSIFPQGAPRRVTPVKPQHTGPAPTRRELEAQMKLQSSSDSVVSPGARCVEYGLADTMRLHSPRAMVPRKYHHDAKAEPFSESPSSQATADLLSPESVLAPSSNRSVMLSPDFRGTPDHPTKRSLMDLQDMGIMFAPGLDDF